MISIDKILNRLTDLNYIKHSLKYYPKKISMIRNMARLERYHLGYKIDLSLDRSVGLKNIVRYANKNCPYYNNLFSKSHVDMSDIVYKFGKIPLLDKGIIRGNVDTLVSTQLHKMKYGRGNTGGSTGEPLEFYTSVNYDTEHQGFLYKMIGYKGGDRILALDGSFINAESLEKNVYWKKKSEKDVPYGSMALSSLYLNEDSIAYYFDFINNFKPTIIRGYPSFVHDIATYMLNNNKVLGHTMKGIVLTSESANTTQIHTIATAFNTKIYLQYGHSEASLFGYTIDDSYEYYCSPFYGFVEVINDIGEHVGPGELGEVVCTGFYNYAMPFIRYRTGDLAVFLDDHDGIVRLRSVLGRTQDYIYDSNNNKTLLTALVFGLHYKAFSNIRKWQIIQDEPGKVNIFLIKDKLFDLNNEEEIRNNFLKIAKVATKFQYVENIPLTKRGKSRFLVQNIE